MNKCIYTGADAVTDYLRPDVTTYSPLVEIPPTLNPYYEEHDIHIYVKLLNTLPLSNVKSLPAWNMLENAPQSLINNNIVESSSGNTVFSLGILAKKFGVKKVLAVASKDVSQGKLDLLRIAGVDVQLVDGPLCPRPNDPESSIEIARKIGESDGWHNPGQYDNGFNPAAHRAYTGPQIYDQLNGMVSMVVAGLGTTGTLVGTSDYLRSVIDDVRVVGVVRAPNNTVPGVRTKSGLDEVAFAWQEGTTDELITISERDAFEKGLSLIQQGLLVGPSTGFAFAGVLKQLEKMEAQKELNKVKGKNIVFIAPDSMFPYVSDYLSVLDSKYFGKIDDQTSGSSRMEAANSIADIAELTVEDIYNDYTVVGDTFVSDHYRLVDVREPAEYEDYHVPDSHNVPFDHLDHWLKEAVNKKPIVFICQRGIVSLRAARIAKKYNMDVFSMLGGTAQWSKKELPRILSSQCKMKKKRLLS